MILPVSALQLIMGGGKNEKDLVGDSQIKDIRTPAYDHHTEIDNFRRKFQGI